MYAAYDCLLSVLVGVGTSDSIWDLSLRMYWM